MAVKAVGDRECRGKRGSVNIEHYLRRGWWRSRREMPQEQIQSARIAWNKKMCFARIQFRRLRHSQSTTLGPFRLKLLNRFLAGMTALAQAAAGKKSGAGPGNGPAPTTVKLVRSAGDAGRTDYSVKLSARLTPGNDALHR